MTLETKYAFGDLLCPISCEGLDKFSPWLIRHRVEAITVDASGAIKYRLQGVAGWWPESDLWLTRDDAQAECNRRNAEATA